ncbi:hypothetical protein LEP1GSC062_4038 [Leptospira alexanderi serovar Manhao 3 str. L 60]|uniref:Uncharacterized protein n=1 Tax=Leptospira alexanderi serovar Manhao 3 str. L 60 TaxID=1049759 RepID=V6I4D2_9LEPT|nr:hypothetical protein LEP1GSC062_4038 [Leptospira alexanderi serovar Manhao 3 str. L 60]
MRFLKIQLFPMPLERKNLQFLQSFTFFSFSFYQILNLKSRFFPFQLPSLRK